MLNNIKKVLVLSPHTDDGEFGCGGTITKLIEMNIEVFYVAFSACEASVPDHLPSDILRQEVKMATDILGINKENLLLYNYEVRTFNFHRQEILEHLIQLKSEINPDLIFMPSKNDMHQDHHTIADEGMRAFKYKCILCYEVPWNNLTFNTTAFVKLDSRHIQKKVEALKCYKSQQHRSYANEEFIFSLSRVRGTQIYFVRRKIILLFVYMFSLMSFWFAYYYFVVPVFGYSGFIWTPNLKKIAEGIIIIFFISCLLPTKFNKPSDVLIHLHMLLPILPMTIIYGAINEPRIFYYFTIASFLIILFLSQFIKIKPFTITRININELTNLLIGIGLIYLVVIIAINGFSLVNFDLFKVYEFRVSQAQNLPAIFGYLSPFVTKVIFPFILIIGLIKNNKIPIIISIFGGLFAFALTSHKGPLFYPLLSLAIYFFINRKNSFLLAMFSFTCLLLFGVGLYIYSGDVFFGTIFTRRSFFVPAMLNYLYYDFFSSNPHVFWAESSLTFGLVEYPYDMTASHIIGDAYYSANMGANTGWIGTGYMHLGFPGMILYAILVGLLFATFNGYAKKIDPRIITATCIAPILSLLISSDLPTSFFTHGILLTLLLYSCLSKQTSQSPPSHNENYPSYVTAPRSRYPNIPQAMQNSKLERL